MGKAMSRGEELDSIEEIQRGDQIKEISILYSHHYIVENVDIWRQKINVIHYSRNVNDGCGDSSTDSLRRVKRDSIDFEPYSFLRIIYKKERYGPEEVVKRALGRLGETDYDFLTKNCEHFATWCKTGKEESRQATKAKVFLGVASAVVAAAVAVSLANESDEEPNEEH